MRQRGTVPFWNCGPRRRAGRFSTLRWSDCQRSCYLLDNLLITMLSCLKACSQEESGSGSGLRASNPPFSAKGAKKDGAPLGWWRGEWLGQPHSEPGSRVKSRYYASNDGTALAVGASTGPNGGLWGLSASLL